jgi:O-antigen/teichoic acid export membrane protein
MSYYVAPRRPRFVWNTPIFRELLHFSAWLHLKKLSFWGGRYVDSFAVNALLGVASLGVYNRAFNLASLPNNQTQLLSYRIFAPLFASARGRPELLARFVGHAFNVTLLTSVPVLLVMMLHGETLIHMILGDKWSDAGGLLGVLSLGLLLRSLNDVQATALRAAGKPRFEFIISGAQVAVTAAALAPAIFWKGLEGAAYALVLGNIVAVGITERLMRVNVGISLQSQGSALVGILAGCGAAYAVSHAVTSTHTSIVAELANAALELSAFFFVQLLVFLPARGGTLRTIWWAGDRILGRLRRSPTATVRPQTSFSI